MSITHPNGAPSATPDLVPLLDKRGRRRSPASVPGYQPKRPPVTKGQKRDPEPLPITDMVQVLAACVPQRPGRISELSALRLRTMIVVMWRTGIRSMELLDLEERDLARGERIIIIRNGKGGKRRPVVMDDWGWQQLDHWLDARRTLPPGKLFCVLSGPTAGQKLHDSELRREVRAVGLRSGIRRRLAPHQLRHTCAADMRREKMDLLTVQKQLGHAHVGVTQAYLRGIDTDEVLDPMRHRKPPMMIVPTG